MFYPHDPDRYKAVVHTTTCPFHQRNPREMHPGCTCSTSYGYEKRPEEEVQEIKAARRIKEEDEILRKADAIRARRQQS